MVGSACGKQMRNIGQAGEGKGVEEAACEHDEVFSGGFRASRGRSSRRWGGRQEGGGGDGGGV